jgi:hypothetical protein
MSLDEVATFMTFYTTHLDRLDQKTKEYNTATAGKSDFEKIESRFQLGP